MKNIFLTQNTVGTFFVLSLLLVLGCQTGGRPLGYHSYQEPAGCVIISDADNGTKVRLNVGQTAVLHRSTQAIPGGSWVTKELDSNLLALETKPEGPISPPGSRVGCVYEITALRPGKTLFQLVRSQNYPGTYQVEFVITEGPTQKGTAQ